MVEVLKTNVKDRRYAAILLSRIHKQYHAYAANFDLEDCDKILRVESKSGFIETIPIIRLLQSFGFEAEVLSDISTGNEETPSMSRNGA